MVPMSCCQIIFEEFNFWRCGMLPVEEEDEIWVVNDGATKGVSPTSMLQYFILGRTIFS